jgi:hypothetical protein
VTNSKKIFKRAKSSFEYQNILKNGVAAITEGEKTIPENAFSACENLIDIILPESLEIIGEKAFWYCQNLKRIDFKNKVLQIDRGAF